MRIGWKIVTVGGAAAVTLLVAVTGLILYQDRAQEVRFCTLGLAIVPIDGHDVALQDGGKPGKDGCESDDTSRTMRVLGLDCKIREPDGDVVAELVPNRDDGLCGLFDAGGTYPDPWPQR